MKHVKQLTALVLVALFVGSATAQQPRKINIDFKDVNLLQSFVPERGRIMPRRITGTCAWHQRKLGTALKRARIAALLPFVGV